MLLNDNILLHDYVLQISQLNDTDHGDYDVEFIRDRMKADSWIAELKEDLREAKITLEEFERKFDDHMPNLRKLKRFKDAAKDILGNDLFKKWSEFWRNEDEEEYVR